MDSRRKILILAFVILSPIFNSSYHFSPHHNQVESLDPPFLNVGQEWVDSVYESLSRDERIAQLFMVRAYSNKGDEHKEAILKLIRKHNIGGVCFFQGGPARQANLTNIYQSESKTPLLVALDADTAGEEGKSYCWEAEELRSLLTKKEYARSLCCHGTRGRSVYHQGAFRRFHHRQSAARRAKTALERIIATGV